MIETEREAQVEKIRLKALRLITPERANSLNIPTESPVFVSPVQNTKDICLECGENFEPLIYQTGYKVEAHHFHQNSIGGIYYSEKVAKLDGYFNHLIQAFNIDWFATVDPAGSEIRHSLGDVRSPNIKVERIRAFCTNIYCMMDAKSKELTQGNAYIKVENSGLLLPICSLERHPSYSSSARYNFKITENGEVLFSEI